MRSRWIRLLPVFVLVAGAGAGAAMAATAAQAGTATVKAVDNAKFGRVLVAGNGHTLYRFTADSKGKSTCTGSCLTFWPKLLIKAGVKPTAGGGASASLLGTIKAGNGMAQVTYAGFPLYFFAGDKAAGQTTGEGTLGKWYVVSMRGALVKHPASSTTHTSTSSSSSSSSSGGGWG
jgi:predicted lipoprotein with Yx(FWY)xxD motif